jgi:hypothetical protein
MLRRNKTVHPLIATINTKRAPFFVLPMTHVYKSVFNRVFGPCHSVFLPKRLFTRCRNYRRIVWGLKWIYVLICEVGPASVPQRKKNTTHGGVNSDKKTQGGGCDPHADAWHNPAQIERPLNLHLDIYTAPYLYIFVLIPATKTREYLLNLGLFVLQTIIICPCRTLFTRRGIFLVRLDYSVIQLRCNGVFKVPLSVLI